MRLHGAYFRLNNVFGCKIAGSQHSSPSDSLGQSQLKKLTVMTDLVLKRNTYTPVSEKLPAAKLRVTVHCAAAFFLQVPKWCTDLDRTLLYILIHRTYTKFVRKKTNAGARRLLPAAIMLERWPHVCRVKITFTVLPTNRFVFTTTNSMKCLVNWIPLRIRIQEISVFTLNTSTSKPCVFAFRVFYQHQSESQRHCS